MVVTALTRNQVYLHGYRGFESHRFRQQQILEIYGFQGFFIVADGAKILGPIVIGKNTVIAAGAITTKSIPANSIAYGVNQYKPKNPDYDLVFNPNMISGEEIMKVDEKRVAEFDKAWEFKI